MKNKITPEMAGCWLDGHVGWHNHYRVLEIARAHGWRPDNPWDVRQAVKLYQRHDPGATIRCNKGRDVMTFDDAAEWITGQGGLADQATDYLQSRAPEGYLFVWDMGELLLLGDDEE